MANINLTAAVRSNLSSLQDTAALMAKTSDRLSTGNKVNSALDNPTNFFTASSLNSRAGDLNQLMDSMNNGIKTIEAASNGLTAITKSLESMQSTLRQARQDKSFQASSFEVMDGSTLKLNGGQVGADVEIKLQEPTGGTTATVTGSAAYSGVTPSATEGLGARAIFKRDAAPNNDVIKIDGKEITLTAGDAADVIAKLGTTDAAKYNIKNGDGTNGAMTGAVIIEAKNPLAAAPVLELGAGVVQDTKGTTSFKYTAGTVGAVTVGGQSIATGASFDEFVTGLQSKAEAGKYTVNADKNTGQIVLTNTEYGASVPSVVGIPDYAAGAVNTNTLTVTAVNTLNEKITIDGVELTTGAVAASTTAAATQLRDLINGNSTLAAKYVATGTGSDVIMTTREKGVGATLGATVTGTGTLSATNVFAAGSAFVDGKTVANGTTTNARATTAAAASDDLTVNYGSASANVKIVGMVKAGAVPTAAETTKYQADTISSVNAQLKSQGLDTLKASFTSDGKFQIAADGSEAKTLAISGENASTLFGGNTVSTGAKAISAYTSTATVDKFVEEVNRSHAGSLRASNDNGKLRIENLSTQKLDVSFDKDGASLGAPSASTINGNSVREGMAKQFNELRDQLDKLSADASFNGINLLRGDNLKITFNETATSSIDIGSKNGSSVNAANMGLADIIASDLDADSSIDAMIDKVKESLNTVRSQASAFGSNLSVVQNRQDFTKSMINTLETGAGNLTLADMNQEAANMMALQTRQSLASSTLSMANQADQGVLQLLR